ncbi:MAG: HAMP domain-containing histidine kinase [Opitutae bacterium]|nr:HAMP domain-containing histidine kinase [Opitutae bacterium]
MNTAPPNAATLPGYRAKLLVAMMVVVSVATGLGLLYAQRNLAESVRRAFEREFRSEVAAVHAAQEVRDAALAERCRALATKPRLRAALEDNALDLLYPSARDELAGVVTGAAESGGATTAFRAEFYRFLDARGAVIPPLDLRGVGALSPAAEKQLSAGVAPARPQRGYIAADGRLNEILAVPIPSSETGETIAVLVLGFRAPAIGRPDGASFERGLWLGGQLHLASLRGPGAAVVAQRLAADADAHGASEHSVQLDIDGAPSLLFYKLLNPDSAYPPAYEVCVYSLDDLARRQRVLLWQFFAAWAVLLLGSFAASRVLATRLSRPVEKLALDSEQNRADLQRTAAALEMSHEELARTARFSANASHQLKTPVAVLRTGLEDLLASKKLDHEAREEVSTLVHQTFRLTSVIEDLLLLSRLDEGRLRLELAPVNLVPLIDAWLDDLSALPEGRDLIVERELPDALRVLGEQRYTTLILQNLLENARKYNRPGGRVRIAATIDGADALLVVGNTGAPIPPESQAHIFERFHRGAVAENKPGHGLGLNLARELARLHRGDLRLLRSADDWTEFAVRFVRAEPDAPGAPAPVAPGVAS